MSKNFDSIAILVAMLVATVGGGLVGSPRATAREAGPDDIARRSPASRRPNIVAKLADDKCDCLSVETATNAEDSAVVPCK